MPRKTFLSRIDNSGAVNGPVGHTSKQNKDFMKAANAFCEKVIMFLLQRVPGFHDVGKKRHRHGSKKRKVHSRILGI